MATILRNAIHLRPGQLIFLLAITPVAVLAISVAWTVVPIVAREVVQHVVTAVVETVAGR